MTLVSTHAGNREVQLSTLFDLHRKRWRRRGLPGAFLGRLVAFQRDWTREALAQNWLRLTTLQANGQPIGAYYGMQMGNRAYYYQAGFDPDHCRQSPGTVLVAHAIREAIEDGATSFDMMRGDEPYKRRWNPTQVHENLRYMVSKTGARAVIGSRLSLAQFQWELRIRARLGEGELTP